MISRMLRPMALAVCAALLGGPAAAQSTGAGLTQEKKAELLEQYCHSCHNVTDWAGGLALDIMSLDEVTEHADVWEKTIRKLRGQLMPPPGSELPDPELMRQMVSWLEETLDAAAADKVHPGRVGLHRLNRREYANAVQDLLDLRIDPAALLPRDEAHDGFDNIASALQISPSFMDQYLAAAHKVAAQALGNAESLPVSGTYSAAGTGTQQYHRDGLPFGTRGGMVVDHYFPADGEYTLSIANMAASLWVQDMEHENTLVALLDGKEFYRTTIGGETDMRAIDQEQDPAVDAINARLKNIKFKATAGMHKVAVTFVARTFAESDNRLQMSGPLGLQDRIKRLTSFEIRGPFTTDGLSTTPSRAKVFICYPQSAAEEQPCAERIIATLANRAFRGAVDANDQQGLMKLYARGRAEGGFEDGIRFALAGILASPSFLYRAEFESDQPGVRNLTDLELASRLSFFLWSSIPDDELLKVAKAGKLQEPATLEQQVRRMLADPRAQSLVTNFAFQWLNVAKLEEISPDARVFPYASGMNDLREPMREELRLFIDSILRSDASVLRLLDADHTYLNERLALHYGITDVKGDQFQRVQLKDSSRYGLLGKGAILTLTSYPNRTAPVLRGAWILERITGTPPAPPPPNVEGLNESAAVKPGGSIREVLAAHSSSPNCFSCHGVMDPLGFALENFDAVGAYRELDRQTRAIIDTSGKLPDGVEVNGPDSLRRALLSDPNQFVQTVTEKLLTYAVGRPVEHEDMPLVRRIVREVAKDDYKFASLVLAVVNSDPFRKTMPAAPAGGHDHVTAQR